MKSARLALVALLLLPVMAGQAAAAGKPQQLVVSPSDFEGLPGVSANPKPDDKSYKCETVLRRTDRIGEIDFFGDSGMPRIAYRCEKDGFVYEGSRPPTTGKWIPGINPHHLPE